MESSDHTPLLTPFTPNPPSTPVIQLPASQWLQRPYPALADAVSGLPVEFLPLRDLINQPSNADAASALGAILSALTDHANSLQTNLDCQRASLDLTSHKLAEIRQKQDAETQQRAADENTARQLLSQVNELQNNLSAGKSLYDEWGQQLQEATQRLQEATSATEVFRQQLDRSQTQAAF
jgi:hypothetical protein